MKIIKTLLFVKTLLSHNCNYKVYPLNNAVSTTFHTHHRNQGWQSRAGRAGWPAIKNAGGVDVFNPLIRISLPRITCGPRGPTGGRLAH